MSIGASVGLERGCSARCAARGRPTPRRPAGPAARPRSAGRLVAARQLDQVAHERRQLLALLDDVGEQAAAVLRVELAALEQHLDVRPQARNRRAQLMRGVGDQLALGAHRLVERRAGALQPVEHGVEAPGELADLVVGVDPDAPAQVLGLADVLGRLGDLAQRREHPARGDPAERGGERDARRAASSPGRSADPGGWSRRPLSGRASWTRAGWTRRCERGRPGSGKARPAPGAGCRRRWTSLK